MIISFLYAGIFPKTISLGKTQVHLNVLEEACTSNFVCFLCSISLVQKHNITSFSFGNPETWSRATLPQLTNCKILVPVL